MKPSSDSLERAKDIVSGLRKNVALHVEEWDESRYLEGRIALALDSGRAEERESIIERLEGRKTWGQLDSYINHLKYISPKTGRD